MEHNKTFESEQTFLMKFHQLLLKNKCLYSIPALRNFVGAFKYERKNGMVTFHSVFYYFLCSLCRQEPYVDPKWESSLYA